MHERGRVGRESTSVDSLLSHERGIMSIVKDRIRPLDPSSLQEFLEPDGRAQVESSGSGGPLEIERNTMGPGSGR